MIKKHDEIKVEIVNIEFPDKGIGYIENEKIIMRGAIPGQIWLARVFKIKKGVHVKGLEILRESNLVIQSECAKFGLCGGCTYQNILYETELANKQLMVKTLLAESGIDDYIFDEIVKAPSIYAYRNKMEYTFGDEELYGDLCLGMRKKNTYYETVDVSSCLITHEDYGEILRQSINFFKSSGEAFFHRIKKTGTLRNLIVRRTYFTNEILINIVTTSQTKIDLMEYVELLKSIELVGCIKGIIHTITDSSSDAVNAESVNVLFGNSYFHEKLLGLDFKISAFSFFQTNSKGAECLYSTVKEFAANLDSQIVFDLYCGTGTIAQLLSKTAQKVIGIEIVEEAVVAARENALLNNITNCEFIAGDVFKVVKELEIKPQTIILDPPREGINSKVIMDIINFNANTIVYVSCKPTSLMEDLVIFIANGYKLKRVRCHDMFPRTANLETVALLEKI